MSYLPARSLIDLGGLQLTLKSGLNVSVAHGNPITTLELPPAVDSEVVFNEVAPSRGFQVAPGSSGEKRLKSKHRILSGGAAGDATVTISVTIKDRAGNTMTDSVGLTVTPSTQPNFAFDIEHVFDFSGFGGDMTDASIIVVIQRTGSGDTLLDPVHLLQSWIEVAEQ